MPTRAAFPGSIVSFGAALVDRADIVLAQHVNTVRDEVVAIETALGKTPQGSKDTVADRLAAIETAANNLDGVYVSVGGGSIVSAKGANEGGIGLSAGPGVTVNRGDYPVLVVFDPTQSATWGNTAGRTVEISAGGRVTARTVSVGDMRVMPPDAVGTALTITPAGSTTSTVDLTEDGILYLGRDNDAQVVGRALTGLAGEPHHRFLAGIASSAHGGAHGLVIDTSSSTPADRYPLYVRNVSATGAARAVATIDRDGTGRFGALPGTVAVGAGKVSTEGLVIQGKDPTNPVGTSDDSSLRTDSVHMVVGFRTEDSAPPSTSVVPNHLHASMLYLGRGGTTVRGNLRLTDNESFVWSPPANAQHFIRTRARNLNGPSDLRPAYWDELVSMTDGTDPAADQAFGFVAPATGHVKITLSAELSGNISRSALSYNIIAVKGGRLELVKEAGFDHCISFNAPAVDVPEDYYYQNLTNVFTIDLNPGGGGSRTDYWIQLRAQRAVPGTNAAHYFPGDVNYPPGYPWGKYFPVTNIRVLVEPLFSLTRVGTPVPSAWTGGEYDDAVRTVAVPPALNGPWNG